MVIDAMSQQKKASVAKRLMLQIFVRVRICVIFKKQ